ncbi:MAG: PH domain-containing protein [Candidatus Obscuribacterales bacterium]|nr:PH domain-containing protein [Candidatus Obscuribacterales bacterium]
MATTTNNNKPRHYRLKSMVLARIFAEITVLILLVLLPLILTTTGHLQKLPLTGQVMIFSLCLIAGLILPAYAFITWMVRVDADGITAMSVAKHQSCRWSSIKRVSRRSNFNWVRYVIEHSEGELSFPIWLVNSDELLRTIRDKSPKGAGISNPFRRFSQDRISLLFQLMNAALGIGLVVVFWFFFAELARGKSTNQSDLTIVLAFCLAITLLSFWRTYMIAMMPKSVETTASGIVIDTMFSSIRVPWAEISKVGNSWILLPEGFMLGTEKGTFLIGNGMDAADELIAFVSTRIPGGALLVPLKGLPPPPSIANVNLNEQPLSSSANSSRPHGITVAENEPSTIALPDGTRVATAQSQTNAYAQGVTLAEYIPSSVDSEPVAPDQQGEIIESANSEDWKLTKPNTTPGGKMAPRHFRKRKRKDRSD